MKVAYIMQNYSAASELWLQRQLEMLKDNIVFIAAIDNKERYWKNRLPVINLYSDYPFYKKLLIKLKLLRVRTPQERYNEVLQNTFKKNKVDVILINYLTLAYELKETLLTTKLPIVIHTHGYDITWDLLSTASGARVYDESYFKFARDISKKSLLIANSNHSKNKIAEIGINKNNILVKKFGVPIEGRVRSAKVEAIKILFIGRLIELKAPNLVIKAFERACEKGLNGELLIAGGGPLELECKRLREQSKYKEQIKILGVVGADYGQTLRKECDIFTAHNCKSTSTNQVEAFGVSIIEAMSAGLPVVTGKSGGVVDSIVHGETGFLFEPGDVKEHADRLLELAENDELRKRMGVKGIERVKQYFSLDGEKLSLKEILDSAIKG